MESWSRARPGPGSTRLHRGLRRDFRSNFRRGSRGGGGRGSADPCPRTRRGRRRGERGHRCGGVSPHPADPVPRLGSLRGGPVEVHRRDRPGARRPLRLLAGVRGRNRRRCARLRVPGAGGCRHLEPRPRGLVGDQPGGRSGRGERACRPRGAALPRPHRRKAAGLLHGCRTRGSLPRTRRRPGPRRLRDRPAGEG